MNPDGTISPDDNPRYVLAHSGFGDDTIGWVVKSDDKNRLIFENAQEILGVSETHG